MYAAVDLGATSGRVISGRLVDGRLETEEVARFANTPVSRVVGERELLQWDIDALWSEVRAGLATASRSGPLRSVGVDTWAVDYGLLGADRALLGNPVHYRDARTQGMPDRFFAAMPADQHYAVTGAQVQPFNTVFQLMAEARLADARRLLMIPDLLTSWLTGRDVTEVTNASTTGLLDVRSRQWSPEVLRTVTSLTGVDVRELLADVVEPGAVVGALRAELGCGDADVVAVGSHDTASAVAAVPMADPSRAAYISSGTWSLVGVELREPVLTPQSRAANLTNELGVDGTVRYLKNVAGLWLLTESQRTWYDRGATSDLAALLAAAADVPARRTVVDVDDPRFAAPGDMPARIAEVARASGQPVPDDEATVTRCILDSLALGYRRALRQVAGLAGLDLDVVHVVGGGSRNGLLCQLTADAVGLPVLAGPAEGTAMGNLLVQAWASGDLVGGLPAIRDVVRRSTEPIRWEPTGDPKAWDQAESRLSDLSAARQ